MYLKFLEPLPEFQGCTWLLNIRGNDVVCNPVVLSYAMITLDRFYLFINETVLKEEVKAYFKGLSVTVCPYNDIYTAVQQLRNQKVLLETARTNYAIVKNLDGSNKIIDKMNPTALLKAMKNPVEVENMGPPGGGNCGCSAVHQQWLFEHSLF